MATENGTERVGESDLTTRYRQQRATVANGRLALRTVRQGRRKNKDKTGDGTALNTLHTEQAGHGDLVANI